MARTPRKRTYDVWYDMHRRCYNPDRKDYPDYGEKGIRICREWMTFEGFLFQMGLAPEGKSIERIDNSKGYCKANCKWATWEEQNNNKSDTHFIEYNGIKLSLTMWARRIGIKRATLSKRLIEQKWDVERALTTPVKRRKHGIKDAD